MTSDRRLEPSFFFRPHVSRRSTLWTGKKVNKKTFTFYVSDVRISDDNGLKLRANSDNAKNWKVTTDCYDLCIIRTFFEPNKQNIKE